MSETKLIGAFGLRADGKGCSTWETAGVFRLSEGIYEVADPTHPNSDKDLERMGRFRASTLDEVLELLRGAAQRFQFAHLPHVHEARKRIALAWDEFNEEWADLDQGEGYETAYAKNEPEIEKIEAPLRAASVEFKKGWIQPEHWDALIEKMRHQDAEASLTDAAPAPMPF